MYSSDQLPVTAYIALGSNLADPLQQVSRAIESLRDLPQTEVSGQSAWYRSDAIGPGDQPDYVNGVVQVATSLSPPELFAHTQAIENAQGRQRRVRWAARTLDLDILLYGDQIIDSPALQIPHPRLTERNFVIYPLADIEPALVLPNGTPLQRLLASCPATGIARMDS